jgi:uncharacterized Tic20 family protein
MRPNVWIIMEEQRPEPVILSQGTNSNRNIGNGTASHLCGPLLNLVFPYFSWVVPLILYSTNSDEDPILKHHLTQSLNASITFSLALLVHTVLMFVCLGFITALAHWIMYLLWSVNANNALKARQMYNYPFTINFVSP